MKEPYTLKNYEINNEIFETKIIFNSFWENWQLLINGKGSSIHENRESAIIVRDKMFKPTSKHKFYRGQISNPFGNKLLVIGENKEEIWTYTFKIAKSFALKNQIKIINQLTFFK